MFMEAEFSLQVPNDLKSLTVPSPCSLCSTRTDQAQWEEMARLFVVEVLLSHGGIATVYYNYR